MLGTGGGGKCTSISGNEPFYLMNADVFSDYKIDITKKLKPNARAFDCVLTSTIILMEILIFLMVCLLMAKAKDHIL